MYSPGTGKTEIAFEGAKRVISIIAHSSSSSSTPSSSNSQHTTFNILLLGPRIASTENKILSAVNLVTKKFPNERIMVFSETIDSINKHKDMLEGNSKPSL